VISTSFADIFRQNALKNSLVPVVVPRDVHAWLFANPEATLALDLAGPALILPDGRRVEFPVEAFAKHCLLDGVDELGYILQQESAIAGWESTRPRSVSTIG